MIFSGVAVFFLFKVALTLLGKRYLKKEKYGDPTKNHSVLTTPFGKWGPGNLYILMIRSNFNSTSFHGGWAPEGLGSNK